MFINIKTHNLNFFQASAFCKLPTNLKIGIYGGSFNPPHLGQLYVAEQAIKKLDLNILLWLVTPLNPLKITQPLKLEHRVFLSKELTKFNHRIHVSAFENSFSSYYSYLMLDKIKQLSHNNSLIWIMGEDNLANFHLFANWQYILKNNKIAVFARGDFSYNSLLQKASFVYKTNQIDYFNNKIRHNQHDLQESWLKFFLLPKKNISSTQIRARSKKIS